MINKVVNYLWDKAGNVKPNRKDLVAFVKFLLNEGYTPDDIMEYGFVSNGTCFGFDRDYFCIVCTYVEMCDIQKDLLNSDLYFEKIFVSHSILAYFTGPIEVDGDLYYIAEVAR